MESEDKKFLFMLIEECKKAEKELKRIMKEMDVYNYPVKKNVN